MSPFRRLAGILRPDRGDLLAVALFAIAIGVLLLATPIAVQALVNSVALGGAIPPLIVVALLLSLGLMFAAGLSALQTWVVEILQRRIFVRMTADLAARLPRVAIGAWDKSYGPELVNRFFDVVTIQKVGSGLLLDGLSILLSVLVGLVVLAFYHPLLLAFDIILLASITLIVLGPVRRGIRTATAESKAKYAVAAWLEEIARNPLLFKSGEVQTWLAHRSDELALEYVERRRIHFRVVFAQVLSALALQVVASTALLAVGGLLVIQGSLTLGQLVAAELIVTLVVSSVAKLGKHIEGFYDLMAATEKVGRLLDLPLEGVEGDPVPAESAAVPMELRSVAWSPPGSPPLLEDLTLQIEPGERLCLRGSSGSGKSTLLELLWGLRQPQRGVIRIGDQDLRDLSLESLRRSTTLVTHVEIAEDTIRENVRLGRPSVSNEDVHRALRAVGLADELEVLPDGLDTRLTASGRPLSSGQVHRMQVARAIVGRPRLLMIADSFAHLSHVNRSRVLDVLFAEDRPWTLIIASDEPDVIERCDRVLELPSGTVLGGPPEPRPLSA